jgi:hypothetical protein
MRQDVALRSHFRLAGLTCLVFLSAVSAVAAEKWVEVRSSNFRVISAGSEQDAHHVAHEFEQMRQVFSAGFPNLRLQTGAPLLIFALRDENRAKAIAPQFWEQRGGKPAGFFAHGWEKR